MTLLFASLLALDLAGADALLECRRQRDAFDTDGTIRACGAAANDATLDLAARIFALRLAAGAHLLKKDERAAEMVLVRMLAFDADAAAAPDDGPDFRRLLERARQTVLAADALDATIVRDGGRAQALRVVDRHTRVARAELAPREGAAAVPLARFDDAPGISRFALPAGTGDDARVVLLGWTGKPLKSARVGGELAASSVAPRAREVVDSSPSTPTADATARLRPGDTVGWSMIAGGAAVALAGAVFFSATTYDLNARVPCDASPDGCVPDRALLFGIYSREDRTDLFTHQTAWLSGSFAAFVVGGAVAGVGASIVTAE